MARERSVKDKLTNRLKVIKAVVDYLIEQTMQGVKKS